MTLITGSRDMELTKDLKYAIGDGLKSFLAPLLLFYGHRFQIYLYEIIYSFINSDGDGIIKTSTNLRG